MSDKRQRVFPNGECWCGCGEETDNYSFFVSGHDRRAESNVIAIEYGSVAQFVHAHGFGPGKRNSMREREAYDAGKRKGRR